MGKAPELVPDEFFTKEARPYIPSRTKKEELMESEGMIVF